MIYFDKPFECMATLPDGLVTAICNIVNFKKSISLTELAYELMHLGFIVTKDTLQKAISQFPFFQYQYDFDTISKTVTVKKESNNKSQIHHYNTTSEEEQKQNEFERDPSEFHRFS